MLRTCSHAMLNATAVVGLTALTALSSLTGCTIYTYSGPPPRSRAINAPPPAPPPPPPSAPRNLNLGGRTPARPTVVNTTPPPPVAPSNAPRITSPNAFGNGNSGAFRGLAYVIPEKSTRLPTLDSLVPFATLFTDSFEIPAQNFNAGFPGALRQSEWFAIRYEGYFNTPTDGVCTFDLQSTDGALLSVDGQPVVNNDGIHGAVTSSGKATLRAGLHQLRLDYFKGALGVVALKLYITVGTGPQSVLVGVQPR